MSNDLDEWKQCMSFLQYFLDYRTKVFGFCITITSALLSVSAFQTSGISGMAALVLVGILILIFGILADRRSVALVDEYREAAISLESKLGFVAISQVHSYAKAHKPGLRHVFRWFYTLLIMIWAIRLVIYLVPRIGGQMP